MMLYMFGSIICILLFVMFLYIFAKNIIMYFKAKSYNDLFSELTISIIVFVILLYYIWTCIANINEL